MINIKYNINETNKILQYIINKSFSRLAASFQGISGMPLIRRTSWHFYVCSLPLPAHSSLLLSPLLLSSSPPLPLPLSRFIMLQNSGMLSTRQTYWLSTCAPSLTSSPSPYSPLLRSYFSLLPLAA